MFDVRAGIYMKQYQGFWLVIMFNISFTVDLFRRHYLIWALIHSFLIVIAAFTYGRYLWSHYFSKSAS